MPLVKSWSLTVHQKLPEYRKIYDNNTQKLFSNFAGSVTKEIMDVCPDLGEAIDQWRESTLRTVATVHKQSKLIFEETIKEGAKEAHRLVKPKILDTWLPIFVECGDAFGSKWSIFLPYMQNRWQCLAGHYKRNQEIHNEYVKANGRMMYKKGSQAIQKAFKKLFDSLPEIFEEGTSAALNQIREEFEQFLQNHTARPILADEGGHATTKARLQAEVLDQLDTLKAAWSQVLIVPKNAEEEEDSEEEEINVDDLDDAEDEDGIVISSDEDD